MRLLLASIAALAAVTLAAPSFAQDTPAAPTPIAKPKHGTPAYCNTLKSTTSKNACLKRLHAQATTKPPAKAKAKKLVAAKPDTSAQAMPTPHTPPQTINVPPLPQKTI